MVKKSKKLTAKTGNEAAAEAMRQIAPDVVAAYPITPATEIVQIFSKYVADGEVVSEFIDVESEHSAMSACIGASASGARAMTATSSQGLAFMWEMLHIASGMRFPIIMTVTARSIAAPINIHGDHSDIMGAKDAGWVQLFSENVQEVYDNLIQAPKIAEKISLPVMVIMDGFTTSHLLEGVEILKDNEIKKFIGKFGPESYLLDTKNPKTFGAFDLQDYYFEHKRAESKAMEEAGQVIKKVGQEFGRTFGRKYDLVDNYKTKDAETIVVAMGATCETMRFLIDELRKSSEKVGLLKIRTLRPFPEKDIQKTLSKAKKIIVLDKSDSYSGAGGSLFKEIKAALYGSKKEIIDYIYGLGGRDTSKEDFLTIFKKSKEQINYLGVRE